MVAITSDPHLDRYPEVAEAAPVRLLPFPVPSGSTAGGVPSAPAAAASRVLLVVAAVVVVLATAVGTAALGRVLDAQRGIPTSAPAPAAASPAP